MVSSTHSFLGLLCGAPGVLLTTKSEGRDEITGLGKE